MSTAYERAVNSQKQQYESLISESTSLLHLKVKSHSRIKQQIKLTSFIDRIKSAF